MKILIVTNSGNCLGFADRLSREGHEVVLYPTGKIKEASGIYTVSDNLRKSLLDCRICISDLQSYDTLERAAKQANRFVIGTSSLASIPNLDYIRQYYLFNKLNLPIPETQMLDDVGEAIQAALNWGASRTIIKYQNKEFKCDYKDWLAWAILRIPVGQKILFQKLVFGRDVVVTGWFDGLDWADMFSISPEIDFNLYKYASVAPISKDGSIIQSTFPKLTEYFKKLEYKGPVHLYLTVKGTEIYTQRMHVGFLFPIDYTILEFARCELGKFFNSLSFSETSGLSKTRDFVAAVQATCNGDDMLGAPLLGINDERMKHLVLQNVKLDTDQTYCLINNGIVATATAHGPSIDEMCSRVYETVEGIKFPEKHYNLDLGAHVSPHFEQLKAWRHI